MNQIVTPLAEWVDALLKEREALRAVVTDFMESTAIGLRGGIIDSDISTKVERLCEATGYGNVMATASMLWRRIDDRGAFLFGPCEGTARSQMQKAETAMAMTGLRPNAKAVEKKEKLIQRARSAELERDDWRQACRINAETIVLLVDQKTKLLDALRIIAEWKMPPTGKKHEDGTPMSYSYCYGSNGERNFVKSVAQQAVQDATAVNTNGR